MTVIQMLLLVLFIVVVGSLAAWIINKFLPEKSRMISMAVVGVVLLLILFGAFLPELGGVRIWGR